MIPECFNLSVGYDNQHTKRECLDSVFLLQLIDALAEIDFSSAPILGPKKRARDFWFSDEIADNDYPVVNDFELLDYVITNPEKVASFLERIGANVWEIENS